MKILDFETIQDMSRQIEPSTYYDWVDDALRNKDEFSMPVKASFGPKGANSRSAAPCFWDVKNLMGVKVLGRYMLREGEQRSLMMGDILLYEADSGILKAVMDAVYITTIRTAATAVHSTLLYGKSDFSVIGLIGLGNIMTSYLDILLAKIGSRSLTIKLYRYHGQEDRFQKRFASHKNLHFEFYDSYEEVIKGADIIVSAVTRVTNNFVADDCYCEGCTVIPIMTMGFQNCDLFFDQVFTDEIKQIRNFKYFNSFRSVNNTSDVLRGAIPGRLSEHGRILVYNYGLALHDLYFAKQFYERSNGFGKDIDYQYSKKKYFM